MGLYLFKDKGTPLEKQRFTWKDLVKRPLSKLNDDAFSRIRILLLGSLESEARRFSHACALMNQDCRSDLAQIRRIEHHQSSLISALLGADHSALEMAIAYEQMALEITAALSEQEPDSYLAQCQRYTFLEDLDHLYRLSALIDRLEGKDANNILQSYTDIAPGRPAVYTHRDPSDDLRRPYDKFKASFTSKMNALMLVAMKSQMLNYYIFTLPFYSDPTARQLLCEIASIEEQHLTEFSSLIDPKETWAEKWLLHEAHEVQTYYSCVETETNEDLKTLWERFLDYELGHLQAAISFFQMTEGRDAHEILPEKIEASLEFKSKRQFIRSILHEELDFRSVGMDFIHSSDRESQATINYREYMNAEGSPSEIVAAGYVYRPGTENSLLILNGRNNNNDIVPHS